MPDFWGKNLGHSDLEGFTRTKVQNFSVIFWYFRAQPRVGNFRISGLGGFLCPVRARRNCKAKQANSLETAEILNILPFWWNLWATCFGTNLHVTFLQFRAIFGSLRPKGLLTFQLWESKIDTNLGLEPPLLCFRV